MCFEQTVTFDCNHKHTVERWCKNRETPLFEAFKPCKTIVSTDYIRHVCPTCALQGLETDSEGDDEAAGATESAQRVWNSFGSSLTFARVAGVAKRALRSRKTLFRAQGQRKWRKRWYPLSKREVVMVRQVIGQRPLPAAGRHRQPSAQVTRNAWVVPGARPASTTNDRLSQGQSQPGDGAGGALIQQLRTPSLVRGMLMPQMEAKCKTRSALDKDELFFEMVEDETPSTAATSAHYPRDISMGEASAAKGQKKQSQKPNASQAGGAKAAAVARQTIQRPPNMSQAVRLRAAGSSGETTTTSLARPTVSRDTTHARAADPHVIPRKPVPRRVPETLQPQIHVRIGVAVEPKPLCPESLKRRKGRPNLRADAAKDGLVSSNACLAATITRPSGPRPEGLLREPKRPDHTHPRRTE